MPNWTELHQSIADIVTDLEGDPQQEWIAIVALMSQGISVDAILKVLDYINPIQLIENKAALKGALAMWNDLPGQKQKDFVSYELVLVSDASEKARPEFERIAQILKLAFDSNLDAYMAFLNQRRLEIGI